MLAGLSRHHQDIRDLHLRDLFASDPARGERLVAEGAGLYLDYSNQCGPSGAGHFVKKVHNGIEYGIMAAYAEGLNIIHSANIGKEVVEGDAETDPMEHPEYYQSDIDTREVAEVWRRGSVISSWLLDLTAQALHESPTLEDFSGVYRTPGRDAGLRSRRSTRASRRRCSRPRFTRGLPRGGWTTTPTGCCPRCASSSEDTPRRCWTNVPPRWAARDERHRRLRPREAARRRGSRRHRGERDDCCSTDRLNGGVPSAGAGGAGPRRTLPADFLGPGAHDTASRGAALISFPEHRGRSRFRHPGNMTRGR